MAIKMIYTVIETVSDDQIDSVGKIIFFDKYSPPSAFFPYFYLSERSQTLNYDNWPELVKYFYDKKLGFFTTINNIYQYKDIFEINGFDYNPVTRILTLKFVQNTINETLLRSIKEDRDLYFFENGNYTNWNRTITPVVDLIHNSQTILFKDSNYFINDLNYFTYRLDISINLNIGTVNRSGLTNQTFEFGLHRLPNRTKFQSIYYHGIKGKTFAITDNDQLISGLRSRSQIMGHTHDHTHNMAHTHTMSHTHDLSNHSHGMLHNHGYGDSTNNGVTAISVLDGNFYSQNLTNASVLYTVTTGEFSGSTDIPSNNITQVFNSNTSVPNNNNTSGITVRTTNKDNNHSTDLNFKVGNKTFGESYPIFPYMYARKYIPT